jgi:hypothetical protein
MCGNDQSFVECLDVDPMCGGPNVWQAGVPEGFILTQLTVSTMGLIPLFIIAPRFLWKCLNSPAQELVTAQSVAPQK